MIDDSTKEVAKKAADGDKESAITLVLLSPPGSFKDGGDPTEYAKKVSERGSYPDDEEGPGPDEARLSKLTEMISSAKSPREAAECIMKELGRAG